MHPHIYNKFDNLLSGQKFSGPVLEVGAIPGEKSLLNLPVLKNIKEKSGINLDGPYTFDGIVIHKCNANRMEIFPDNHFGLVLCNAMLEHDKYFWKTISEIKRVTKPGGLVVIGTPGYAKGKFHKFKSRLIKYSWYKRLKTIASLDFIFSSTLTYEIHGESYGDFYRFSPAAYREVFFKDFKQVSIIQVMQPPRIIGLGFKPEISQNPPISGTEPVSNNKSVQQGSPGFSYPQLIENSYASIESQVTYEKEEYPVIPESTLKLIAFYLPQFHPFEENDRFWGKGFTEWHNVTRALPLFPGHYQPRLPGELGFYDLRVKDVMYRQVELAKQYGIYGFCFHHYFLDRKPVMRLPFNLFLNNQELDFPFCIHWANEPWTQRWDGNRTRGGILLDQSHDDQENMAFIADVLPAFKDKRYIQIDGKPLLLIYRPGLFPEFARTAEQWREHSMKEGFKGLFLVMVQTLFDPVIDPTAYGCDAAVEFPPHGFKKVSVKHEVNLFDPGFKGDIFSFREYMNESLNREKPGYPLFRGLFPQWDNTSRRIQANVFHESTPALYQEWLSGLCRYTRNNLPEDRQLVFINAWNEWAEGAYLEPDRKFGYAYLNATARALNN